MCIGLAGALWVFQGGFLRLPLLKGMDMSSAGFFNNYIKGRDNMYSSLARRRELIAKTAGLGPKCPGHGKISNLVGFYV